MIDFDALQEGMRKRAAELNTDGEPNFQATFSTVKGMGENLFNGVKSMFDSGDKPNTPNPPNTLSTNTPSVTDDTKWTPFPGGNEPKPGTPAPITPPSVPQLGEGPKPPAAPPAPVAPNVAPPPPANNSQPSAVMAAVNGITDRPNPHTWRNPIDWMKQTYENGRAGLVTKYTNEGLAPYEDHGVKFYRGQDGGLDQTRGIKGVDIGGSFQGLMSKHPAMSAIALLGGGALLHKLLAPKPKPKVLQSNPYGYPAPVSPVAIQKMGNFFTDRIPGAKYPGMAAKAIARPQPQQQPQAPNTNLQMLMQDPKLRNYFASLVQRR